MSVIVSILSKFDDKGIVGAQKGLNNLNRAVKPASKAMSGLGIAAGGMIGIGVGAWLIEGVNKAKTAEASWATLGKVVDNTGVSFKQQKPAIDAALTSVQNYAAVSKGDLRGALQNIIIATGSEQKGLAALSVTTDLARAKNIDLAAAGQLVGRALAGNTKGLQRYGIVLDKGASSEQVLIALEKKLGGTAGEWAKTSEGRTQLFNLKVSALQTNIGTALLPAMNKLTDAGISATTALGKLPEPVISTGLAAAGAAIGVSALAKALATMGLSAGASSPIAAAILGTAGTQVAVWTYMDQTRAKLGEMSAALKGFQLGTVLMGPIGGGIATYNKLVFDAAAKTFGFGKSADSAASSTTTLGTDIGKTGKTADTTAEKVKGLKKAVDDLRNATISQHSTQLAELEAMKSYRESQKLVNDLKRDGKTKTIEYKIAVADMKVKQDEATRTHYENAKAIAKVKADTDKAKDAKEQYGARQPKFMTYHTNLATVNSTLGSVLKKMQTWQQLVPGTKTFKVVNSGVVGNTTGGGGGGADSPTTGGGSGLVRAALKYLGVPYVWGGMSGSGMDCSGLTSLVARAFGIGIPRTSRDQFSWFKSTGRLSQSGRPGDFAYFGNPVHHTGVYMGNGQMVEAPYTGAHVRIGNAARHDLRGFGRLPGFSTGGVGDFGSGTLAVLHGLEGVFTRDQMRHLAPAGRTVTIGQLVVQLPNFNGDARQLWEDLKSVIASDKQAALAAAGVPHA